MRRTFPVWTALLVVLVPAAFAQTYLSSPGYADLSAFASTLGGHLTFDLDADHQQIAAMVNFASPGNEGLADLVDGLESVRARVFDLPVEEREAARASLAETATALKAEGWSTFVSVKDSEDQVEMLLKTDDDRILGVAALFVGDDEAGFANVVGEIELAQIVTQLSNFSALRQFLTGMKEEGQVEQGADL